MALLDSHPNPELEATVGRFFKPEIQAGPDLDQLIVSLKGDALRAMETLGKWQEARAKLELGKDVSALVSKEDLEEAWLVSVDQAGVWRQRTDGIANKIVTDFPEQELSHAVFGGSGAFVTNKYQLIHCDDEGQLTIYNSVIPDHELKAGARIATEEEWHGLVTNIFLHLPQSQ